MSVSLVDFFSRRSVLSLIVSCCLAAMSIHAPAQETDEGTASGARDGDVVHFGGPNAVGNRIEDDAKRREALVKERALQPWFDWKE